jgi:hypothetical protein
MFRVDPLGFSNFLFVSPSLTPMAKPAEDLQIGWTIITSCSKGVIVVDVPNFAREYLTRTLCAPASCSGKKFGPFPGREVLSFDVTEWIHQNSGIFPTTLAAL